MLKEDSGNDRWFYPDRDIRAGSSPGTAIRIGQQGAERMRAPMASSSAAAPASMSKSARQKPPPLARGQHSPSDAMAFIYAPLDPQRVETRHAGLTLFGVRCHLRGWCARTLSNVQVLRFVAAWESHLHAADLFLPNDWPFWSEPGRRASTSSLSSAAHHGISHAWGVSASAARRSLSDPARHPHHTPPYWLSRR